MKIDRKIQNISFISIGALALIGLILGTIFDQKITGKMGDFNNLFGILFTALGPVLTLAFGVFVGATLFFMNKTPNKIWNIIFKVLGAVAVIGFVFVQVKEGIEYVDFPRMQKNESTYKALIIVLIALIDLAIILFTRFWVDKMDSKVIIQVCLMILAIILCYFVLCEGTKYLASRPRPRVIDQGLHEFKQWYQWKPFAALSAEYKDCKSFVSGHSANATCLVSILPLVASLHKRENNNIIQILTIVIGGLFALVVALSRIVARAHFMTDVMGGILLSIAVQAVVINVAPLIIKKFDKNTTNEEK